MSREDIQKQLNQVLSLRRYSLFLDADPYALEEMMDKAQVDLLQLVLSFFAFAQEEQKGVDEVRALVEQVRSFIADGKRINDITGRRRRDSE